MPVKLTLVTWQSTLGVSLACSKPDPGRHMIQSNIERQGGMHTCLRRFSRTSKALKLFIEGMLLLPDFRPSKCCSSSSQVLLASTSESWLVMVC